MGFIVAFLYVCIKYSDHIHVPLQPSVAPPFHFPLIPFLFQVTLLFCDPSREGLSLLYWEYTTQLNADSHCVKHSRVPEGRGIQNICPVSVDLVVYSCNYEGDNQKVRYTLGNQLIPKLVIDNDGSKEFKM